MNKAEVRELSQSSRTLPTWDKPASPCFLLALLMVRLSLSSDWLKSIAVKRFFVSLGSENSEFVTMIRLCAWRLRQLKWTVCLIEM